jgi:hypothetical protein
MASRGALHGVGCARKMEEPPTIDPPPLVQSSVEIKALHWGKW